MLKHVELDKKDVSSGAQMGKPYKNRLEDMTERENVGVLVVDERSVLKHCRETGRNEVIFPQNKIYVSQTQHFYYVIIPPWATCFDSF
jgi:hypothetical protein